MKIFIDWKNISTEEEFYSLFLSQVDAPEWHGHNLDALADSIVTGGINKIEPPFCVINQGVNDLNSSMKAFFDKIQGVFKEANEEGRKIRVFSEL